MTQCSILFVNPGSVAKQAPAIKPMGFLVTEVDDLPHTEELVAHHVVVVAATAWRTLPMLGAHLRAKPHFGRRVLVALTPPDLPARARREAVASGFDAALSIRTDARTLAATLLRLLRPRPEHRCVLRPSSRGRRAA